MSDPKKVAAKLTLEVACPECGESLQAVALSGGKSETTTIDCDWCSHAVVVPAVWVKS